MNFTSFFQRRSPYELRKNLELVIIPKGVNAQKAPFSIKSYPTGFLIELNSSDQLLVKKLGVSLYDSGNCHLPPDTRIQIFGKAHEILTISNSFRNSWEAGFRFEPQSFKGEITEHIRNLLIPIFKAGTLHGVVVGGLLLLFFEGSKVLTVTDVPDSKNLSSLGVGEVEQIAEKPIPFAGVSIQGFQSVESIQPARVLSKTGSMLRTLFKGFSKPLSLGLSTPPQNVAAKPVINTQALLKTALKSIPVTQTANVNPPSPNLAKFSNKEANLRQRMETLKPKLTEAFDQALRIDPSLSITLSYEATVNGGGKLADIKLQTRGKFTQVAVTLLENSVRQRFESFEIGKEFAGITLRGEQLFIK